MAKLDAYSRP